MNTEIFIEKAKSIHGNKYDYSKTNYISSHANVLIICPIHGEFYITATNHLSGRGCPSCGKELGISKIRKTTEQFIKEAKLTHGDKYDYTKTVYQTAKGHVVITCPIHGDFSISPTHHLSGDGCVKCNKILKEEKISKKFVLDASTLYNKKYDYSKMKYIGMSNNVEITCPIHGSFFISPKQHLNGLECPICTKIEQKTNEISKKIEKYGENILKIGASFVRRASVLHKRKYDYSLVTYNKSSDYVYIICPTHGIFKQTPNNHLHGEGCPKCIGKGLTTNELIDRFKGVHGDKYDYSKVVYEKAITPIIVTCPIHGDFLVSPNKHLMGRGCPRCKDSYLERKVAILLNKNEIFYERDKKFDWLKNESNLRIDFYLEKYGLCIECQGSQHIKYYPNAFSRDYTLDKFKLTVKRDIIKYNLLTEHGFKVKYFFPNKEIMENAIKNPMFKGIYTEDNSTLNISEIIEKLKIA